MDVDPSSFVGIYGPWTAMMMVVMTVVLSMIRGLLIPWLTHEREIAIRDRIIVDITKERDYYRDKHEAQTASLLGLTEAVADRATQKMLLNQSARRSGNQAPP